MPPLSSSAPSATAHRTQLLVVGGGPAGSATAWYCAKAGFDVTVVDRARFPRAKPCAEYVSPEGARILDEMGALQTLESGDSARLSGMVVHAPNGNRIHGEFVAQHGFRGFRDKGLGVRREVLDTLLLDRARSAGVRVLEGAKVDDLLFDARGQCIGARVRADGALSDIHASLVIGADGLRSVVSRRLGLARQSRWPKRVAIVAHFCGVHDIGSLGEMHVTARGYVGLAAVGKGVTNVALVVPRNMAADIGGDASGFLMRWLNAQPSLAPRFREARAVSAVRTTGPFASQAKRPWAPGAMLVGDAADFYDPFTGEGIYAALLGGELVAPFVADVVCATSRGDHAAALRAMRAYQRKRERTFRGKWRVERLIGAAVASPWLMNAAAGVLGRDRDLADLLVGVTGDFVPTSEVLTPRTIWRVLRAVVAMPTSRSQRTSVSAPTPALSTTSSPESRASVSPTTSPVVHAH